VQYFSIKKEGLETKSINLQITNNKLQINYNQQMKKEKGRKGEKEKGRKGNYKLQINSKYQITNSFLSVKIRSIRVIRVLFFDP